jgi:glutamate--cysteine ligase
VKSRFDRRLRQISDRGDRASLRGGLRGVEKECLRVTPGGHIAATDHPATLGSALTNRFITTDYSEALIEFITPPECTARETLQFLADVHQFTYSAMGDELLWPLSMPCRLRAESDIAIARYGKSNIGMMKTIYRRGLGHRYGRYMQAIAGVHFNYSVPETFWPVYAEIEGVDGESGEFKSGAYLALVRNVRRLDWLLLYLFGASPAVCRSYLPAGASGLEELDGGSYYAPHATSLRMSDIGYKNAVQAKISVSANSLEEYISDLTQAIRTRHPAYERIGVQVDGEYRQLNANQLQIENEYYSTIRPKRSALSGERPTTALGRGGVEYVELRALDLDPFAPVGVDRSRLLFCEAFLLYCLLADSPPADASEQAEISHNHGLVARRGREPGLLLRRHGKDVSLRDWAGSILLGMQAVAEFLDAGAGSRYREVLRECAAGIEEPDCTPSARMLRELAASGQSLDEFGLALARGYRRDFQALPQSANQHFRLLEEEALASLDRQCWIEEHDTLTLDQYLAAYYD